MQLFIEVLNHPANIIISRTDSIGDVVLTLPMAKALKEAFPLIRIGFMGRAYTRAVIEACEYVDQFIDMDHFLKEDIRICGDIPKAIIHVFPAVAIAKRARQLKIPVRIGTANRLYHWFTCNKLVKLSRKKSNLHEAQLNLKLLKALHVKSDYSLAEIAIMYGMHNLQPLENRFSSLLAKDKYNLVLHPKSQGSAREWGIENFISLVHLLNTGNYNIFISGTAKEREWLQPLFDSTKNLVTDICGAMSLEQFISFISHCDGLVACSTGPLHIAAALNKDVYGIYPPIKPMHPGRWAPVADNAEVFVSHNECNDCRSDSNNCHCIKDVLPAVIKTAIDKNCLVLFNHRKHFEAK